MAQPEKESSRSPENVRKYNKTYYKDNKRVLNDKKNDRYKNDPDYRKKVQARSKRQREDRKKTRIEGVIREVNGTEIIMQKIGKVAKSLSITTFQIVDWESKGLIPKHIAGKTRVYTDKQVQLIAVARDAVKTSGSILKACIAVAENIKSEWMEGV